MASSRKVTKQLDALFDEDPVVRRKAARKLGKADATAVVVPLCQALQDESWFVRRNAAKSLGNLGDPAAVGALVKALGDKSQGVRRDSIIALGHIGDRSAVEPLCETLTTKVAGIYMDARGALIRIGLPAVGSLCRRLVTNNPVLTEHAADTLVEMHYRSEYYRDEALPAASVLYEIIGVDNLTPQQRWLGLEVVRRQRPRFTLPDYLGDASKFCRKVMRGSDALQLRTNAGAIVDYITLARPGMQGAEPASHTLLRGAAPAMNEERGESLLRGSSLASSPFLKQLSWSQRVWAKVKRKEPAKEVNENNND